MEAALETLTVSWRSEFDVKFTTLLMEIKVFWTVSLSVLLPVASQ